MAGAPGATATVTGVAQNAASVTLTAADSSRRGGAIVDGAAANLYVILYAGAASIASGGYTVKIAPAGYYEIPAGYTGEIRGIWDAAGEGYANITVIDP